MVLMSSIQIMADIMSQHDSSDVEMDSDQEIAPDDSQALVVADNDPFLLEPVCCIFHINM